jgi:aminopeptidase N
MNLRPFALALVFCALLLPLSAAQAQRQWIGDGAIPSRYEISITPDIEAASFSGQARITVQTEAPLTSISMNALDLTIISATIDGARAQVAMNEEAQTLTLTARRSLRPGQHTIAIDYAGKIQDDAYGLFRVSYEADGETKRALATQFEPGDARRFAPMWDQPNRRAVFSLTVTAPSAQMAVSNMPAERAAALPGGLTRTRFADTPAMPSYLLFLAVGDFERVTRDVAGVELGVVVRRGETHRTEAALQAGEDSLNYFTEYFGIRYPLPKLDMIGVPGAGGFGAMENWGAILYFDQFLLIDENSSEGERQGVFGIVAHEIAHQWFGNLVTMVWWDDLWLNEGFASWMAAKATERVHPDWNPWLSELAGGTQGAMALDARAGTHPVVQTVNTLEEANLAFDTITYQKGQAVIRMIEAYVGEEDFRNGVRAYLNAHLYGNARTEELWSAIQAASGQPVLDIARSFTGQPGFPVLIADGGACSRASGTTTIGLRQRRFAMDEVSRTGERWTIPVTARRAVGGETRAVLAPQETSEMSVGQICGTYVVNAGQSGFFRVLYDTANFSQLAAAMGSLDQSDQMGLLLDYWTFGRSGDAPFTNYLDLVSTLQADADPLIASDTLGSMLAFSDYAKDRPSSAMVDAYARRTLRPFFDRLGWNARTGEPVNDTLLRAQLIDALAHLGDTEIVAEARRLARGSAPLPPSIRNAVISAYAYSANAGDYDDLLDRARSANDFVEQRRLWLRLASASDELLARRTLQMVLGEEIPRQIRPQVLATVAGSHPRMAWDFLVAHRVAIEALLDPLQQLEFPAGIASASSDPAIASELESYASDFPEGARASIASATATIRLRAQTTAERMPAVEAWIAARERPPQRRR